MHGQKYLYELLENYFQQMSVFDFEFVEEKKKDCFEIEHTVKNPISNTIYSGKFYLALISSFFKFLISNQNF